jgi:hypothetical protein
MSQTQHSAARASLLDFDQTRIADSRQGDGACDTAPSRRHMKFVVGAITIYRSFRLFGSPRRASDVGSQIPRRRRRLRRSAKLYLRLPPMLDMSSRWSAFAFPYRVGVDSEAFLVARNLPAIVHL